MKIKDKMFIGYAILKCRLLKKNIPLAVGWSLTNRCNYRCKYCWIPNVKSNELTTEQIFSIIGELSGLGTKVIQFTGGEPLLRDDIGKIISYTKKKGISSSLNSNGSLVPSKIKEIKGLDLLKLSLDGPEKIQDKVRQKGSYKDVMNAIRIAKENNIKVALATVLSKYNLKCIDFVLDTAKKFDCSATFQLVEPFLSGTTDKIKLIAPEKETYKKVIEKLIYEKKKNQFIGNSSVGLKHLLNWPDSRKVLCAGGQIGCRIETDGDVNFCGRLKNNNKLNAIEMGFRKAFDNLNQISCNQCWCAAQIELNQIYSLNLNAILNQNKLHG